MRHTWKLFGLTALLALVPAVQADPELPKNDVKAELRRILDELNKLNERMDANQKAIQNAFVRAKQEADILRDRIADLEREVAQLKQKGNGATTKSSFYGPPAPTATGTLVIHNRNALWTATVVVNGTSYVVPPMQDATISQMPAGNFTYYINAQNGAEFATLLGMTTGHLLANNTKTITINPS
jgi:hypothetical protein